MVPFLEFDAKNRLGHERIDAQHAGLVAAVNALHEAVAAGRASAELGRLLANLRVLAVEHFQTEEQLMEASGYPGLALHRGIHGQLTRQVLLLERKFEAGALTLTAETFEFLKAWLVEHIDGEDRRLVAHLRSRRP